MRENMGIYRGKRKDGKGWVEGYYTKIPRPMIFVSGPMYAGGWEWIDVDPDTVGEATGFSDKNGVKVFEGDIVHAHTDGLNGDKDIGIIRFGHYRHADASREYMCGDYGFYIDWVSDCYLRPDIMYWLEYMEVVGNIHDNCEMLEPSKNPAK